ncbi:MAG: capsular polysaccharide synthesis protein [Streptococcaceae bacterium]|nr:capsular polysaccharide synthesis protein [Streptococcaceae bacterium]
MKKLNNYIQYFKVKVKAGREFGFSISFLDSISRITLKFRLYKITQQLAKKKNYRILDFLEKEFAEIPHTKNQEQLSLSKTKGEKIVWTCWWQGEENAPVLVKKCMKNLKKNNETVVITKYNYKKFVQLSSIFIEKLEKGNITLTHFSDILRIALLKEHGGLWLDSTCFTINKIPDFVFDYPIFMGREKVNLKCENYQTFLSQEDNLFWHLYVLGGKKDNLLFTITYKMLEKYWQKYDTLIDYFLIDYLVYFVYLNFSSVKEEIDRVGENMGVENFLQSMLNLSYNDELMSEIKRKKDIFFKLSYKKDLEELTKSGKKTFYNKLFLEN